MNVIQKVEESLITSDHSYPHPINQFHLLHRKLINNTPLTFYFELPSFPPMPSGSIVAVIIVFPHLDPLDVTGKRVKQHKTICIGLHATKSLWSDFWSILYHFHSNIRIKIWPRNYYYLADSSGIDRSLMVYSTRVPPSGPTLFSDLVNLSMICRVNMLFQGCDLKFPDL